MARTRDYRRAQRARIVRRIEGFQFYSSWRALRFHYHANDTPEQGAHTDALFQLSQRSYDTRFNRSINTPAGCSCSMCGQKRRHNGPTAQERRAPTIASEIAEINEEQYIAALSFAQYADWYIEHYGIDAWCASNEAIGTADAAETSQAEYAGRYGIAAYIEHYGIEAYIDYEKHWR